MADLGVAHQTLGKADSGGGRLKLGVPVVDLGEAVHDRAIGVGDGVTILGRLLAGDAPPVDDDWSCQRGETQKVRLQQLLLTEARVGLGLGHFALLLLMCVDVVAEERCSRQCSRKYVRLLMYCSPALGLGARSALVG